jgi:hypothetical protein
MAHIEPALVRGELYRDFEGNDILGAKDDFEGIDTPVERLADHCGIDLDQAALALDFARRECREDALETAAELIGKILAELLPSNKRSDKIRLDVVGIRALSLRIILNRDGTTSLTQWAERADTSKQLLSWHIKQLEALVGVHWLAGKRPETSAIYSEATRQRWAALTPEERKARRKGKKNATPTPTETHDDQRSNLTGVEG